MGRRRSTTEEPRYLVGVQVLAVNAEGEAGLVDKATCLADDLRLSNGNYVVHRGRRMANLGVQYRTPRLAIKLSRSPGSAAGGAVASQTDQRRVASVGGRTDSLGADPGRILGSARRVSALEPRRTGPTRVNRGYTDGGLTRVNRAENWSQPCSTSLNCGGAGSRKRQSTPTLRGLAQTPARLPQLS